MLLAAAALPLLGKLVPMSLPIAQAPAIDLRVLIFAGLISGLTGIGFGVFPALARLPRRGFQRRCGKARARVEGARNGCAPRW